MTKPEKLSIIDPMNTTAATSAEFSNAAPPAAAAETRPPIRILAIDLDDTLLHEDLTLTPANRDALRQAEDAGVAVLLASGRVPGSMYRYAKELGMLEREGYMIAGNGTLLIRTDTGEELVRQTLPVEEAAAAFREIHKLGHPVSVYHQDTIYASRDGRWVEEDCRLSGFKKVIVEDFAAFIRESHPLKLLIQDDADIIARLEPQLKERYGDIFHIITSKPFFLELLPKTADKGSALRYLAEYLQIPSSQVMAIGDSINDLGMIRFAGIGVAVGNALPEVKAAASVVLDTHHSDNAVAEAVETYILKPFRERRASAARQ
jgi:Cof subfamily protein (haloacid dehalogenase superfamily)